MNAIAWPVWGKWVALTAVAAAIVIAAPPEPQPEATSPAPAKRREAGDAARRPEAQRAPQPSRLELERMKREDAAAIGNAFQATSWYVPPPAPPAPPSVPSAPPPPPKPTAPPLPFTYLGTYEDKPARVVILVKGERMYTVSEGEVIESTYRVERVADGFVELTYLPLDMKQTLMTRGAS